MKSNSRRFIAAVGIGTGLMMPVNMVFGDSISSKNLSAEWWQYVFSIPPSANPLVDTTGDNCVVGQHGAVWFLTGAFLGDTNITRTCQIPEGKSLFFPALNYVFVDAPGVCGQDSPVPVDVMRAWVKACLDGATEVSVEVDGSALKHLRRVESVVFEATFPEDNIYDEPCAPDGVPGGTYSPSVDEGYYVEHKPLSIGSHVIRIRATAPACEIAGPVSQDVTYNITVVPTDTDRKSNPMTPLDPVR